MRVISGWLGGRIFDSPRGHRTHPMSEKMRGAIFGALGDIKGLTVLDAFSGSGAIAIEAISRGAREAQAIEMDVAAAKIISRNITALGIDERIKVTRAYAGAWSTRHQAQLFDIVILDPPYDNIPYRDLKRMPRHVNEGGILVLSWPGKVDTPSFEGLDLVKEKDYGDGKLAYYQRQATK
jgi:16S rRNA (guanine966-N2)-methyltransferase